MLELLQQSESDIILNAIEKMPNFSHEIQSNSVLTRRIMALKKKNKPEQEKPQITQKIRIETSQSVPKQKPTEEPFD
jgi:hypothetical protein